MKNSIKKSTFKAIYRLLDKYNPINGDCGLLCGAACCSCDDGCNSCNDGVLADETTDFEMGLYLLPGEEKIFSGKEPWLQWGQLSADEYEFPESWHGSVPFLRCITAPQCDRSMRPIQCRTFPLAPHIDESGELLMIYQCGQLPYECPLISQRIPLNNDFVKATYTVWKHLITDPLIYDLVEMDSQYRIEDGEPVIPLYPEYKY